MRHSASSPSACQKVISRRPKRDGSSQFHSCRTTAPPTAMKSRKPRIASGARNIHFLLICSPSSFLQRIVNNAQTLAQMQNRVALPRQERVHADTGLGGHFLEAFPFEHVADEHLA